MSQETKNVMLPLKKTSAKLRRHLKMLLGKLIMTFKGYACDIWTDIWMLHCKEKNS